MGFDTPTAGSEAPTDAEYVVLTDDPDLEQDRVLSAGTLLTLTDGGANGNATLAAASATLRSTDEASGSPGLDTWTQVDANRPALVIAQCTAETDGNNDGFIQLQVDQSGGTTADFSLPAAQSKSEFGSNVAVTDIATAFLEAGAQYQLNNSTDPTGVNRTVTVREVTL